MNAPAFVHKYLDLSTAHIKCKTFSALIEGKYEDADIYARPVLSGEELTGVRFSIETVDADGLPEDLSAIVALAQTYNADMVVMDRDSLKTDILTDYSDTYDKADFD